MTVLITIIVLSTLTRALICTNKHIDIKISRLDKMLTGAVTLSRRLSHRSREE